MMIRNAIIDGASIKTDDGYLNVSLSLDYGGSCQSFGCYNLYLPKDSKCHSKNTFAGHYIWRIMEISGVTNWENLIGKTIRVDQDHCGVRAIGHIVNEDWFCPEDETEKDK